MKILPKWIREFVDVTVDDRQFASDMTQAGVAVEGVSTASGGQTVWEVALTPNRVDAMNPYGIAREASAVYDKELKALSPKLPSAVGSRPSAKYETANGQQPSANGAFPIE